MNILAIDTCLATISVALRHRTHDGGWATVGSESTKAGAHAEELMPMVQDVIRRSGLTFMDVHRVAVTLGPGSFTGVRTGIAAARALRLAAGAEVVGVTSLSLIAHRARMTVAEDLGARPVLASIDARRGRIYAELFEAPDLWAHSASPVELPPSEARTLIGDRACLLAGSGSPLILDALQPSADVEMPLGFDKLEPWAADLAGIAAALSPLDEISPIYIRPPDAKPQEGKSLPRMP